VFRRPYTYQECISLMDEAGVDRVLIVPPSWEGDRIDYALEACEAYPGRFGIMARVPPPRRAGTGTCRAAAVAAACGAAGFTVTTMPELGPTLEKAIATVGAGQTAVVNVHRTR
jgi:hypothetical protein